MSTPPPIPLPCPHPDCDATLRIRPDLPAGKYLCLCKSCTISLSWATYMSGERKPYIEEVKAEKNAPT